jgi:tetratricopeptide (TPR) repeat protein
MSSSPSQLKDEGNALLHSNPSAAIAKWALAVSSEDCPEDIKIACYSNSALAHIQLQAWKEAVRCASAAIALSPTPHVKALFRRAQAYRMLGSPGRAAADLTSIMKTDRGNAPARAELDAVTAARLRAHVHADFIVRLLRCDRTDDRGEEAGVEAALCSCLELSLKGCAHEAFAAFQLIPQVSDGAASHLDIPLQSCRAWLLLNTMQFDAAEDVATKLVEQCAAAADDKAAASAAVRADLLMLLAFVLAGAAHYDAALDRCDEAVQVRPARAPVCSFALFLIPSWRSCCVRTTAETAALKWRERWPT